MEEDSITNTTERNEHGTIVSYAVGFVASLILTIVPYYLVTRHILTGNALLLGILGFAILQMFVQMFFFLHLGRGPKPLYNVIFFTATAGMIVMVVGASLIIMDNLYRNMSPEEYTMRLSQDENIAQVDGHQTGACQGTNDSHMVMIKRGEVSPQHTDAHRCDTLILMSADGTGRTFAFGSPESPTSYGGVFNAAVTGNRAQSIVLNQTGDFSFYDQSDPGTLGTFTVKP